MSDPIDGDDDMREVSVDNVLATLEDAMEWINEWVTEVSVREALVGRLSLRLVNSLFFLAYSL